MKQNNKKTRVILNPASANGKTHRKVTSLKSALEATLGEIEFTLTQAPGHGIELSREAVKEGYDLVISVGGDGTNNEIINGFFDEDANRIESPTRFAFLASGTGGDLRRTFDHSADLEKAVAHLQHAVPKTLDLGRATTTTAQGEVTRMYINSATFGLSGFVGQMLLNSSKNLGATGTYLYNTVKGLFTYVPQPVQVKCAEKSWEGTVAVAGFCNGRYFGGGMQFAPHAKPDDGKLDGVIVEGMTLPRWLKSIPKVYSGNHQHMDIVHMFHTESAHVTCEGAQEKVHVELDGELTGTLPARFQVVPQTLEVLI
jgi:diacylglycerol kinase (ATP)